jgi:AcrR family transcriptional regulator
LAAQHEPSAPAHLGSAIVPRPRTVDDDVLLAAALDLIGRVGPARLTLARVAEEVGLAPATLVQRFGSKRGLMLAAARRGTDWAGRFAATRAAAATRVEALIAGLVEATAAVRSPESMANSIAFLQIDLSDDEFHAEALAGAQAMREEIAALLREAVDAGELAGADPGGLADTVVTTYNGALITWAIQREGAIGDWLRARLEAVLAPYVTHARAAPATPSRRYATRRPVSATE